MNELNKMTLEELTLLNRKVVEQIKFLQTQKQAIAATAFRIGDKAFFVSKFGEKVEGEILKVNIKSIKVKTEKGMWNVSPSLLTKI